MTWLAYAFGETRKDSSIGVLAHIVVSIDRHLFLWHWVFTQYYPDIKRIDHGGKWFLSKKKAFDFYRATRDYYQLKEKIRPA